MEYRVLPHGGERISVIGMGSSVIGERRSMKSSRRFVPHTHWASTILI